MRPLPFYARRMPVGPLLALTAASLPAERIRERAAAIVGERTYQTSLPAERAPMAWHLDLGPLGILLRILLWTGLAVLLVLAIVWVLRRLAPAARDVAADAPVPSDAGPVPIRVKSAEALAAAGRYGDAIHALLLETLAALSRAARLSPSLTSREIVARVPLHADARAALSGLVDAVEVSWFGGVLPGADDYDRCLHRFRAFLHTYRSAA